MTNFVKFTRDKYNPLAGAFAFAAGLTAYSAGVAQAANPFDIDGEAALRDRWDEGWDVARRKSRGTRLGGTTSAAIIHDKLEEAE